MSKVCANCGNQMDDNTMFCVNCGAPVPTPAPAPAPKAKAKANINPGEMVAKVKKNPKMMVIIGAALIVVLALVITLVVSLFAHPWKSAMNKYIDVRYEGNKNSLVGMAPNSFWEYIEDEYDMSKSDIKKDAGDYVSEITENKEDIYGKKIKVSYKVVKEIKWTKEMYTQAGKALDDRYDIDKSTVKGGYTVYVEMTVKGQDYVSYSHLAAFDFVKIGGTYYSCSFEYDDEEPSCVLDVSSLLWESESFEKDAAKASN